jgi:hypothetical protein
MLILSDFSSTANRMAYLYIKQNTYVIIAYKYWGTFRCDV